MGIQRLYHFDDSRMPMSSSTTIYVVAFFTGSTGFILSILALVLQWLLPFDLAAIYAATTAPHPSKDLRLLSAKPTSTPPTQAPVAQTRPSVTERHVSFSLEEQPKRRNVPPPLECIPAPVSAIDSEASTLISSPSPLQSPVDLPPLDNLSPLLFEPVQPESLLTKPKGLPGLGPPPVSFNPFRSRRRWSSSSSAKASASPRLDDVPPSPTPSTGSDKVSSKRGSSFARHFSLNLRGRPSSPVTHRPSSSAPTTPLLAPIRLRSSSRPPHNPCASISTIDISSPVFSPTTPGQGRNSLSSFMNRNTRPPSPSPKPLRTQPYGPPYNCPLPRPNSRSSHRKTSSMSNPAQPHERRNAIDLTT